MILSERFPAGGGLLPNAGLHSGVLSSSPSRLPEPVVRGRCERERSVVAAFECGMLRMYSDVSPSTQTEDPPVTRLSPATAVTVRELLDYLRSCGVAARYADESFNGYVCNRKRVNLRMLLRVANAHRLSNDLPPLTIRHLL